MVQRKHKLYGYKTETSVTPCGLTVHVSSHWSGSIVDIEFMRNNFEKHYKTLLNKNDKIDIEDIGPDNSKKETHWAALNDSGYQGANKHFRIIHPF